MAILDYTSSQLLRELSQNSRQSFSKLGRKLGVSGATVARRMAWLEKNYGLRYTLEIDREALGLTANYIIFARLKKIPPIKELERIFKKYPETQYAALTKGDFDLLIYSTASSNEHISRWAHWMRQELNEYLDYWGVTNVIGNWFGFFPLRDELIDSLGIGEPKRALIKLLNRNARMPLKELSKKVGMPMSTTHYHLKQILKSGYVKRATAIVAKPSRDVQYVIAWEYAITPDFFKYGVRARNALISSEAAAETNSLVLAANTIGAVDDIVIKSFDTIKEAQEFDIKIGKAFGPVVVGHRSAFIVEDIVGNLPARNLDVKKEYHGEWGIYDYLQKARP